MTPQVSVILPTYNERENILPLINAIVNELKEYRYEILVMDDQSPDGTAQVVAEARLPAVQVFVRTKDHGYAPAILQGITYSQSKVIVIMDSDFNHDPRDLRKMVGLASGYDCVSASRFLKGGKMSPAWRGVCSRVFNWVIRHMTGSKMTDHLFGYFIINREALNKVLENNIFYGFGDYGIRLLYYLQKNKAKILELPAICGQRPTGHGSGHLLRKFFQYSKETLALAGQGKIS